MAFERRVSVKQFRAQVGDKVRLKEGPAVGVRGIVFLVGESHLGVTLASGQQVSAKPSSVTNFSLAARRAWAVMPKRAGRPAAAVARTRMISVRIDGSLLQATDRAVEVGRFPNRTAAIEAGLRLIVGPIGSDAARTMSTNRPKTLKSRES
jgi:Arc/MetJ-type ribon-helix-helix transcriptional regulator